MLLICTATVETYLKKNQSDHLPNFIIAEKINVNIKQQQKPTMGDFTKSGNKKTC